MSTTTDRDDPRLKRGPPDETPTQMADVYLVLSDGERAKGYVQPYRESYLHTTCGAVTRMAPAIAATYARDPWFYGATWCCTCRMHRQLSEFVWEPDGTSMVPGPKPEE